MDEAGHKQLARRLSALRDQLDRSIAVAIDGASGAGKTSLAFALAREVDNAFVLQTDSYHVPLACAYRMKPRAGEIGAMIDWRRFRETALRRLRSDESFRVEWINPFSERLEAVHEVGPKTVVLCDGTFSARNELRSDYDFSILVQCAAAEARRRRRVRDAAQGSSWTSYIDTIWMPDEEAYLADIDPAHFDLVVDGESASIRDREA